MNGVAESVLVTGGGGFLGSAIVRMLTAQGARVSSFSRRTYATLGTLGVKQIRGDIRDSDAVSAAIEGVDLVFHTAAKAGGWGKYKDYFDINVTGTENVIAACKHHHVSRLIYTSSPSVVFDKKDKAGIDESAPYATHFQTHYPATKAKAEQAVRKAGREGLPTIALRPHLIWGPGDNHLVPRILKRAERLKRVGDGSNLVDTTYIDNAARAHILAARKLKENPALSGNIYFVSQGTPVPLWEMVDHILAAAGKEPVKGSVSPRIAWVAGAVLEGIYKLFQITSEPFMTRFGATELATSHWFDISAVKRDLGYEAAVSIPEGLERLADWLKKKSIN